MRVRNKDLYRYLFESGPDPWILLDREGKIRLVNTRARQLLGYSERELLGQPIEILLPERLRDVHVKHRHRYLKAPRTRPMGPGLDTELQRKDGSRLPVDATLAPLPIDGSLFVSVAFRDASERVMVEQKLRERARMHAALAGFAELALSENDPAMLRRRALAAAAQALQGSCAELLEVREDGTTLSRVDALGWRHWTMQALPADPDSPWGLALQGRKPVTYLDVETNTRFRDIPILREHGITSGAIVPVDGPVGSRAVLGVHRTARKRFTHDEILFLDSLATMLGAALERVPENRPAPVSGERAARRYRLRAADILGEGSETQPEVLVVEDDPETQLLMRRILEPRYRVVFARDADQTWRQLEEEGEQIRMILMDLALPGTSGLELTRRIREAGTAKTLPIIAVTARTLPEDRQEALRAGCDEYVAKPFRRAGLLSMMERYLPSGRRPVSPR